MKGRIVLEDGGKVSKHRRIVSNCGTPYNFEGEFFQVALTGQQQNANRKEPCSVAVFIAGYRSAQVRFEDDMVVRLKPLLPNEGSAMSLATEAAPKEAQQAYTEGTRFVAEHEEQKAEESFRKATTLYPSYAAAWLRLAESAERGQRFAEAESDYKAAEEADPRYLPAFVGAAVLAVGRSQWKQALEESEKAIRLNPVEFPNAYVAHAVAALGLENWPLAESAAKEAVEHDPDHRFPLAEYVLARACEGQNRAGDAAEHFRLYLQQAPAGDRAGEVRARVAALSPAGDFRD